MTAHEITVMFLALGTLLACTRIFGEIAQWMHQPAVLGEIIAGIFLGPTVLGAIAPRWNEFLFPSAGAAPLVLEGMTTLAVALFLLVAGMEVDLSAIWRQGRIATLVGVTGIVVPFSLGFLVAWLFPGAVGREGEGNRLIFATFFATALSISALPVIAKTLMDLNLFRSDFGMVIIAAAVFNDLIGWIIFAVILGSIGGPHGHVTDIGQTIALTLCFSLGMLTVGRWLIHRLLPWIQAYTHWPAGTLAFAMSLALFASAFTEWIGIHAIFGAFLVGVAIGDSSHLREQTRATIDQFISFVFAPLFFGSIGLRVDFAANFDLVLVTTVLLIACAGKVLGCGFGARWGGMAPRDAWAVGFGMNARGAMEIILGLLALEAGLINERLFVALVVMALVTSMMSGPAVQYFLGHQKSRRFFDYLSPKGFLKPLQSHDRRGAIGELARAVAGGANLNADAVTAAVWEREEMMSTGLGHGIAFPHARLAGISTPVLAVGISVGGVDFDSFDGEPAHLIFLILTPQDDYRGQLDILSEISIVFKEAPAREKAIEVASYTEFLAFLRTEKRSAH